MARVEEGFRHVFGSVVSVVVFVLIMLILSASSSSVTRGSRSDGMITGVVEHENILQAVRRVIGSLSAKGVNRCCDEAAVTTVIKVTSSTTTEAAAVNSNDGHGKVDPYSDIVVESLLSTANGLFEFHNLHVRDNHRRNGQQQHQQWKIQHNAVLIVSRSVTNREIVEILLSYIEIDASKILTVIVQGKPMEDIKLMLDVVWIKFTMLNIVIISVGSEGEFATFTLEPFVEDACGQVHAVACDDAPFNFVNFHQCPLRVALFHAPPYLLINSAEITKFSGIDANVLRVLATKFNFTLNLTYVSEDIRWGEVRADNSSSGALSLVRMFALFAAQQPAPLHFECELVL